MKREIRDKWAEALRSGNYEQDTEYGCLRIDLTDNRYAYCCLGVLADILGCDLDVHGYLGYFLREYGPPVEDNERYAAGLSDDIQKELAIRNDTGETFEEIADWIEENIDVE